MLRVKIEEGYVILVYKDGSLGTGYGGYDRLDQKFDNLEVAVRFLDDVLASTIQWGI